MSLCLFKLVACNLLCGFGGLGVSTLASGIQVRGFEHGPDFSGRKSRQRAFLRRGSKAVGPMLQIFGM
jgi:hypothetical protein